MDGSDVSDLSRRFALWIEAEEDVPANDVDSWFRAEWKQLVNKWTAIEACNVRPTLNALDEQDRKRFVFDARQALSRTKPSDR